MPGTFFVIDGHSYIYYSFFGMPPLTNREGAQVQAVYALGNLLLRLRRDLNPTHWVVAMDSKKTFRHERYPEYKANRSAMPDDLRLQFPWIESLLEAFRIPVIRVEGFEADDLVCTVARHADREGLGVRIISKDKDLEQILSPNVQVWDPKSATLYGPDELLAKKGLTPDRVVEYLALVGDSSDNVPGVAGVGPKTALKVLAEVDDVEQVVEDPPAAIPAAALKKIQNQIDGFRLSRELVTLREDAPVSTDLQDYVIQEPNHDELLPLLNSLGFQKLVKELGIPAVRSEIETQYERVDGPDSWRKLEAECRKKKRIALHLTTSGGHLLGLSLCLAPGRAWFLPIAEPTQGSPFEHYAGLRELLEDPQVAKVGHDLKRSAQLLGARGVRLAPLDFDGMIASYLSNPLRRAYELEPLVSEIFGHNLTALEADATPAQAELSFGDAVAAPAPSAYPEEHLTQHAAARVDFTLRLVEHLEPEIEALGLARVLRELELPLVQVLTDMERHGIALDVDRLAELDAEITTATESLSRQIHEAAGQEFNINSPKQLETVLFDDLDFPSQRKTKTGRSTSADVLEELATQFPERPLPALILEYRSLTKLLGTYVQSLPRLRNPETNRIHTVFSQTAAATGRLASSDPNLQNIPIRTELGRRVRRAFVAPDGCSFLAADYSQIELRLLAHLAGDAELIAALQGDADIHREVAAKIHGKSSEEVSREERSAAKAVTFGVIYGMGAFGLSRDLGIPRSDAQKFIDTFFREFPGVRQFIDDTIEHARKHREVRTLFGRRRPLPDIDARTPHRRQQAERFAVNTVVQGTAADLIKKAMVEISNDQRERNSNTKMLLQIHDELLFELPTPELESEEPRIRERMESVLELAVPLRVNVSVGRDWYDASK